MKIGSGDSWGWLTWNTRQHSWQQEEQFLFYTLRNTNNNNKNNYHYLLTPGPTGQVLQLDNTRSPPSVYGLE